MPHRCRHRRIVLVASREFPTYGSVGPWSMRLLPRHNLPVWRPAPRVRSTRKAASRESTNQRPPHPGGVPALGIRPRQKIFPGAHDLWQRSTAGASSRFKRKAGSAFDRIGRAGRFVGRCLSRSCPRRSRSTLAKRPHMVGRMATCTQHATVCSDESLWPPSRTAAEFRPLSAGRSLGLGRGDPGMPKCSAMAAPDRFKLLDQPRHRRQLGVELGRRVDPQGLVTFDVSLHASLAR